MMMRLASGACLASFVVAVGGTVALSGTACHDHGDLVLCPADGQCYPSGKCDKCKGYLTEDIDSHECVNRVPFTSRAAVDGVAAAVWFVSSGLAISAGVGGGCIYVPLGVTLLRFASKPSTGLSQASIFGASFGGLLLNVRARHPLANRPLIDLDMVSVLAPMEMAGALVGVIVQILLPTWAVIVLTIVISSIMSWKTFRKGLGTMKKERTSVKERQDAAARVAADAAAQSEDANAPKADVVQCVPVRRGSRADAAAQSEDANAPKADVVQCVPVRRGSRADAAQSVDPDALGAPPPASAHALGVHPPPSRLAVKQEWTEPTKPPNHRATGDRHGHMPNLEEWLAKDATLSFTGVAHLLVMWLTLIVLLVAKGGQGTSGIIKYCSVSYWVTTAAIFVWLFGFALYMGGRAVRKTARLSALAYPFVEGDVPWTWCAFRFYGLVAFIAGVVAGLVGVSGGMVLGPMLLQQGLHPQVSAATTGTMLVFSSSSAAILYVTAGIAPSTYAATFFGVAFLGACIGKRCIDSLVQKYHLTAIIVLILAGIIACTSATMTVNGLLIYSDRDWHFEGLSDIC